MGSKINLNLGEYRRLLLAISRYLAGFSETRWAQRLLEWERECDGLGGEGILDHLRRTGKALWGMNSIGDVVISPETGLSIPPDAEKIRDANKKFIELIKALELEISRCLNEIPEN
jgi:hypothetical protein